MTARGSVKLPIELAGFRGASITITLQADQKALEVLAARGFEGDILQNKLDALLHDSISILDGKLEGLIVEDLGSLL
jgi:hypothetical protein